ncbi:hypothetical protein GCM10011613_29650 [Cellvibrio zantedeschiae]|uniref:Uncharacterized protein n=1 Tax=Cellvibrio zantedeschiae TaxID=1237077 RepID=A0ABQ3B772_9GAMM|nr:hypothetical protein [Cellvibrio zantedeschiae]GGY82878.1 hypothetical protein GCM10011613_29650 [Cellvibrio zantedeschiae]
MRSKTSNIIWMAAIAIAAISIWLFQNNLIRPVLFASNILEPEIKKQTHTEPFNPENLVTLSKTPETSSTINTRANPTRKIKTVSASASNNNEASSNAQEITPTSKLVAKITDEEAKKVIPHPFNLALGIFKDNDRSTYREFSDAELSDDWDLTMQGQLVDAIYSHPYSNALKIDSIACKAHICEIRLLATNTSAWPLIFADLRQQYWWSFGNNYSIYEFGITQDSRIQTVYFILLVKS